METLKIKVLASFVGVFGVILIGVLACIYKCVKQPSHRKRITQPIVV